MTNPAPKKKPEAAASSTEVKQERMVQKTTAVEQTTADSSIPQDQMEELVSELLNELDYIQHKEQKQSHAQMMAGAAPPLLKPSLPKEKLSALGSQLLGILGHCGLPGHIAHFYNLQFEIEKHIKTVGELDPRFTKAYEYLKSHPSTEAVFVYSDKMMAANRSGGQLIKTVISD